MNIEQEMGAAIKRILAQVSVEEAEHHERMKVVRVMREGGPFARALATICELGDREDSAIVQESWPTMWEYYRKQIEDERTD